MDLVKPRLVVALGATAALALSGKPLAVFHVPARQSPKRKSTSTEGLSRQTPLNAVTTKMLTDLAALPTLAATDKTIILEAIPKEKDVDDAQVHLADAKEELKTLEKDLARLREDAKAIGDRGPLTQPLVTRIVAAEDRIGVVRKKVDELEKDMKKRVDAVRVALTRLGH